MRTLILITFCDEVLHLVQETFASLPSYIRYWDALQQVVYATINKLLTHKQIIYVHRQRMADNTRDSIC